MCDGHGCMGCSYVLSLSRSVALEEEGLYRVSGNKLDVDRLKTVLEAGLLGSQEMLGVHCPDKHVVAGAVKKVSLPLPPSLPSALAIIK